MAMRFTTGPSHVVKVIVANVVRDKKPELVTVVVT
jgi:hypothetical protein